MRPGQLMSLFILLRYSVDKRLVILRLKGISFTLNMNVCFTFLLVYTYFFCSFIRFYRKLQKVSSENPNHNIHPVSICNLIENSELDVYSHIP